MVENLSGFTTTVAATRTPTQLPVDKVEGSEKSAVDSAAMKAAQEFESVFLNTLLEGMFAGLKTDGPFGGGSSEKTYRSMLVGEYAKEISRSGGVGIADHVYREILSLQESRS